jgi:hypothetical protein
VLLSGIQKLNPVKNIQRDIRGKVVRRRLRRPKRSIVHMAGRAKRKLIMPKPREAARALISLKPESRKICEE